MNAKRTLSGTEGSLEKQLRERVKELNCLYNLTRLIEENENSNQKLQNDPT